MKTHRIFPAVALLMSLALSNCSVVSAGFYLTGAQIYKADQYGAAPESYRYTTNSSDINSPNPAFKLGIRQAGLPATRQDEAISFLLLTGVRNFEFDTTQSASLGSSYVGLNLFFSDTSDSFNPAVGPTTPPPIAGHITAVVNVTSGVFTIVSPNVGNQIVGVQSYAYGSGNATPTGSGSYTSIGGNVVTLTSFSASAGDGGALPRGSFGLTVNTLQITATPEPATLGLGGLACVSLIGVARRRLRRKMVPTTGQVAK